MAADPTWTAVRDALRGVPLPALVCDLDAFDANADDLVRRAKPLPVRVASKSLRCRTLLSRVLAKDGFRGVLAFTLREAAWLASEGVDDLLVAYPSVERAGLDAVAAQVAAGRTVRLVVDDAAQLPFLAAAARDAGVTLDVCIDLDASTDVLALHFGVRRSPVHDVAAARALARAVAGEKALRLVGLLAYEAQLAGLPDRGAGALKDAAIALLKRRSAAELAARRAEVVAALRKDGHAVTLVDGGGTGSLETSARDASLTEVAAGSGLYGPALFDGYTHFRPRPALFFALEVTRRPAPGVVTCHGGGYVASGGAGRDRLPVPWLPEGGKLLEGEGAGEVQTPVALAPGHELATGEPYLFRPAKAGETCERFEKVLLLRAGEIVGEAPTYRGEGKTFL